LGIEYRLCPYCKSEMDYPKLNQQPVIIQNIIQTPGNNQNYNQGYNQNYNQGYNQNYTSFQVLKNKVVNYPLKSDKMVNAQINQVSLKGSNSHGYIIHQIADGNQVKKSIL
ncbi:MAG: hypothetical protein II453_10435, partial [Alphaproteobacteria bacterium]|nr:hypothetical protein [Alphaproteobacteria bacterium]